MFTGIYCKNVLQYKGEYELLAIGGDKSAGSISRRVYQAKKN